MLRPIYPQGGTPISILWGAGLDVSEKRKTFAPAGRGISNIVMILIILENRNIFCSFVWVRNVVFHIKQKTYTGAVDNSVLRNIFAHSVESGKRFVSNRLLGAPEGTPDFINEVMVFFYNLC